MPAYDYDCEACGRRFEVIHGVFADPPTACPLCGKGPIRKAISAPTIHYKGSGWAKKERRVTPSPSSSSTAKEGSSSDGASADGASSDGASSEPWSGGDKTPKEGPDKPTKSTEAATASTTD